MTVGERIAARRKELNMTQEELAKKMGYKSKSSINKIEKESSNVPLTKLEKVAKALDCDPQYLMGWDEEEKPLVNNDPELTELLESVRDNPDLRMLFSVTKDATPEDIKKTIQIIQMFRDGS